MHKHCPPESAPLPPPPPTHVTVDCRVSWRMGVGGGVQAWHPVGAWLRRARSQTSRRRHHRGMGGIKRGQWNGVLQGVLLHAALPPGGGTAPTAMDYGPREGGRGGRGRPAAVPPSSPLRPPAPHTHIRKIVLGEKMKVPQEARSWRRSLGKLVFYLPLFGQRGRGVRGTKGPFTSPLPALMASTPSPLPSIGQLMWRDVSSAFR